MKIPSKSIVLLALASACVAQEPTANQSTLKAKSTLVMVPAFVSSKHGQAKDLKAGLIALSNDIPNYYILSFTPSTPTPGLHALKLTVKYPPLASAKSRREYWIDDTAP